MTARIAETSVATVAVAILAATLIPGTMPVPAAAQGSHPVVSKVIPESAADTIYAKVESMNPQTREVSLKAANGETVTVYAESQVPLDKVKVGDKVDAHYYRSVAFLVSKRMRMNKGETTTHLPPDQAQLLSRQAQAQVPGGMSVPMTHISGLVVGVHPAEHIVDVVNPTGGGVYAIQASDPSRGALISSLKVGETVTAVVSPAIATSIEPDRGFFSNISSLFGG